MTGLMLADSGVLLLRLGLSIGEDSVLVGMNSGPSMARGLKVGAAAWPSSLSRLDAEPTAS